jgi:hypothetical protein
MAEHLNLLPHDEAVKADAKISTDVLTIMMTRLALILVISGVGSVLVWIGLLLWLETNVSQTESSNITSELALAQTELVDRQLELDVLGRVLSKSTINPSRIRQSLLLLPDNAIVTQVAVGMLPNQIAVTGQVATREALVNWIDRVEQLPDVLAVDSPASNLRSAVNPQFRVEISFSDNASGL